MKAQTKIFSSLVGTALMGAALLSPANADPNYSVTFSSNGVHFQQAYGQSIGYGQSTGGQWQVYSYPVQQYQGYQYQNESQCPTGYPQYSNTQQTTYCPNQGYQQNQGYQPIQSYSGNQGYQQPTQTVYQPIEPVSQPTQQVATDSFASEVLRLTNQERAKQGLPPLSHNSALANAAASHSQEMLDLDYFSHTSPTPGRSNPQDRVRQAGANPGLVAENIFQASGYDVNQIAQLAVDNWLQSPGHRRNLLDPSATHLGVGFAELNGTVAVTQVFGNRL